MMWRGTKGWTDATFDQPMAEIGSCVATSDYYKRQGIDPSVMDPNYIELNETNAVPTVNEDGTTKMEYVGEEVAKKFYDRLTGN